MNQTFSLFFDQGTSVKETIPYHDIYQKIKEICPPSLNQKKIDTIQNFIETLSEEKRKNFFNETKNQLLTKNISCNEAYIDLKSLETLQKIFQKKTDIPSYNDKIQEMTQTLQKNQYITIKNHNTNIKNSNFILASLYTEIILQETIKELHQKNYLTDEDLKLLSGNIELFYRKQYGVNEGKFYAINQKNQTNLKKISFTFNLYSMESFLGDLKEDIQRLLLHELGHYFFYQKDEIAQKFQEICRKNEPCEKSDFISKYAKVSWEEDFAETFAYHFFENTSPNKFYPKITNTTIKIQNKLNLIKKLRK